MPNYPKGPLQGFAKQAYKQGKYVEKQVKPIIKVTRTINKVAKGKK